MLRLCITLVVMHFSVSALGAKNKDHWYKVESKEPTKKTKNQDPYPYDSVEKSAPNAKFRKTNIWSLRPKLSIGGGYQFDKSFFNDNKRNRLFLLTNLHFLNKPWSRWNASVQLMQNNSLFIGASWEITPSRERIRTYYGIGAAHLLVSEKEFSNLVDGESYYLTANCGWEVLLDNNHGWNVEIKGFWSSDDYAIQVSGGYIIPF